MQKPLQEQEVACHFLEKARPRSNCRKSVSLCECLLRYQAIFPVHTEQAWLARVVATENAIRVMFRFPKKVNGCPEQNPDQNQPWPEPCGSSFPRKSHGCRHVWWVRRLPHQEDRFYKRPKESSDILHTGYHLLRDQSPMTNKVISKTPALVTLIRHVCNDKNGKMGLKISAKFFDQ